MTRRLLPSVVVAALVAVASVTLLARSSQAPASQAGQQDEFLKGVLLLGKAPGNEGQPTGVTYPKVIRDMRPRYTREALVEKLEGQVEVQLVVGADGKVARARVIKSLDKVYGLDEAALEAARQWTFEPAKRNGEAVVVAVNVVLEFRIH